MTIRYYVTRGIKAYSDFYLVIDSQKPTGANALIFYDEHRDAVSRAEQLNRDNLDIPEILIEESKRWEYYTYDGKLIGSSFAE